MPKGDKYIGLVKYLKFKSTSNVMLSFTEIEKLIGDTLPASAYKHRAFWSNTRTHSVAFGWLDADYRTSTVNFTNKTVAFIKQ